MRASVHREGGREREREKDLAGGSPTPTTLTAPLHTNRPSPLLTLTAAIAPANVPPSHSAENTRP